MRQLCLSKIACDYGNAIYRCRLLAKLLELTGRTDVPIGIGVGREDKAGLQSGWVDDYQLKDYRGVARTSNAAVHWAGAQHRRSAAARPEYC